MPCLVSLGCVDAQRRRGCEESGSSNSPFPCHGGEAFAGDETGGQDPDVRSRDVKQVTGNGVDTKFVRI